MREKARTLLEVFCYRIASNDDLSECYLQDIRYENEKIIFVFKGKYAPKLYNIHVEGLSQRRKPKNPETIEFYYKINGNNNYADEIVEASSLFNRWIELAKEEEYQLFNESMMP